MNSFKNNKQFNEIINLIKSKNIIAAKKKIENLIKLEPDNFIYLDIYGLILNEEGKYFEASKVLEKAISINNSKAEIYNNLSISYKNLGKNKKAIDILHKALKLKPNMYSSNTNLAINYIEINDFENATKYLHQSIKIRPKSKNLYLKLSEIYFKLGKIDEAISSLRSILSFIPEDAQTYNHLFNLEWQNDNHINVINEIILILKNQNIPDFELLKILLNSSKIPEVLIKSTECIDEIIKSHPLNKDYLSVKAQLSEKTYNFDEAYGIYKKLSKLPEHKIDYIKMTFFAKSRKNSLNQINQHIEDLSKKEIESINLVDINNAISLKLHILKSLNNENYNNFVNYNKHLYQKEIETPVGWKDLKTFNRELDQDLIKFHNKNKAPIDRAVNNGSHTIGNLLEENKEIKSFNTLRLILDKHMQNYILSNPNISNRLKNQKHKDLNLIGSWSVSLNKKGFLASHIHPKAFLSSAYYVKIPEKQDEKNAGYIHFGQPTPNIFKLQPDLFIKPKEGLLLIFPSYYWHGTVPYDDNRVSISADYK